MNLWVTVYRITWVFFAAAIIVAVVCLFIPKYAQYRELQRQRTEKQEEKQLEAIRLRRLQVNQERFASDPAFVERTARAVGMVKSNETVCKVGQDMPPPPAPPPKPRSGRR